MNLAFGKSDPLGAPSVSGRTRSFNLRFGYVIVLVESYATLSL